MWAVLFSYSIHSGVSEFPNPRSGSVSFFNQVIPLTLRITNEVCVLANIMTCALQHPFVRLDVLLTAMEIMMIVAIFGPDIEKWMACCDVGLFSGHNFQKNQKSQRMMDGFRNKNTGMLDFL